MTDKMETNNGLDQLYAEMMGVCHSDGYHSQMHCVIRIDDDESKQHKALIFKSDDVLNSQIMQSFDDEGDVGPLMLVVLMEGDMEEFVEEYCDEE